MSSSSHSKHPSFSSTLLDAIYRSIDDEKMTNYKETRPKKALHHSQSNRVSSWGSSSTYDSGLKPDAFHGKRLKPIRVWDSKGHEEPVEKSPEESPGKKSRALRMYAGLKKAKQPISPGAGRIAGFLNSLFSGAGKYSKEPKLNSPISKSAASSTCSSASSFSRSSCFSKTPSCRGKSHGGGGGGEKTSVGFSPVSVIVNRNSKSCGDKDRKLGDVRSANDENEEMNKRVEEAARDLLRNYRKKIMDCESSLDMRRSQMSNRLLDREFDKGLDEDDDDDAASCASSDLFELDSLSAIGMERYRDELPVYGFTRLPANNGFIL